MALDTGDLTLTARLRIDAANRALDFDQALTRTAELMSEDTPLFPVMLDELEQVVLQMAQAWKLPPIVMLAVALSELTNVERYGRLK